jgi:Flp pilus assembly protein TadB
MTADKRTPQDGEHMEGKADALFSGILMWLAAVLLLAANLYTTDLWQLKVALALLMAVLGTVFCWKYVRARRRKKSAVEAEKSP